MRLENRFNAWCKHLEDMWKHVSFPFCFQPRQCGVAGRRVCRCGLVDVTPGVIVGNNSRVYLPIVTFSVPYI